MPSKEKDSNVSINELLEQFINGSVRKRKSLTNLLEQRSSELEDLGQTLLESFDPNGDDWAAGWILQIINRHNPESLKNILPLGKSVWFSSPSDAEIDYSPLQTSLIAEEFEEADRFTSAKLRELAGNEAVSRGYVYFSEVEFIPKTDLSTIDRLWVAFSQGKFGFTSQASLLKSLGGRYDRLWPRIGWKVDGVWTRYPTSFTWSLLAPEGHMPLINQLRGVRLMDAILNHPGIKDRNNPQ